MDRYSDVLNAIDSFRQGLQDVSAYSVVTLPQVYTQVSQKIHLFKYLNFLSFQVAHLAVYLFLAVSILGRQRVLVTKEVRPGVFMSEEPEEIDLYIPFSLLFEVIVYMGWLKVASNLFNPFGNDDDDFPLMDLIDRHLKVCKKIVDEDGDIPKVMEDDIWRSPSPSVDAAIDPTESEDGEQDGGQSTDNDFWSLESTESLTAEQHELDPLKPGLVIVQIESEDGGQEEPESI